MKISSSMAVTMAVLLQLSSQAIAEEFLQQVDARIEAAASDYSSRFLDEQLYFAKRHRIVEVNVPMLRETSIDGLTLFEGDEKVSLRREERRESQIHGVTMWIGNIVLPGGSLARDQWSEAEIEQIEKNGLTIEQLISFVGRVELQILYWDIDSVTGEAYPSAERRDQQFGPAPISGVPVGDVKKQAFASVRGQIDLSILGRGIYRLEPLRNSPKYHILYEVDPTKTYGLVETNPDATSQISAAGQRKLDYHEFLKSLPARSAVITKGDLK